MKFSLSWLKAYLDTDADLVAIAATLNAIGLEVEGVEDPAAKLAGFRVARIVTADRHPNADKLRLCSVNAGDGAPLQIVCGAPNARAGIKVVLARPTPPARLHRARRATAQRSAAGSPSRARRPGTPSLRHAGAR